MATQPDYDVAIVGASAAGCTAATLFGRAGLRVALIDREANPDHYKKICNHFIQPVAVPVFDRLGLTESLEAVGAVRNGDIRVFTRWGLIHAAKNDEGGARPSYGYNIRRLKLDPMMRDLAAGTQGVDFMPGQTARRLLHDGRRVAGVAIEAKGGATRELRARLVVGADGRNSRIGELSGVRATVKPNNRFCYYAYFRNLPVPSQMIWFREPDWIYAFPNDDNITVLCAYIHKQRLSEFKRDVAGSFARLYEGLPQGPEPKYAEQITETRGMIEMPNIYRTAGHPGLAFAGDAALATDPMWGAGIAFALVSAEWLVDATVKSLLDGGAKELDAALAAYAKAHRSRFGGHIWQINDYATGRALNPVEKQLFRAAVKDPVTARHFARFEGRTIGLREFLAPAAIARAVWINATRRGGEQLPQLQARGA